MIPYAEQYNIRLVFLNMRDYPGSSKFTQAELQNIGSSEPDAQATIVQILGQEVAMFLHYFIRTSGVSPISEKKGRKTGGLALVGWSLGNQVTLSMFGNASALPADMQERLGRYIRTVVLYGKSTQIITDLALPAHTAPHRSINHNTRWRPRRSV